jgi:hypothetical protein
VITRVPPWAVDDAVSVRREAAPYRELAPEARAALMAAACRAAARLLASRVDRGRVLAYRDPLPESTRRAVVRLREQAAGGTGADRAR